ncbi:MAG: hypothetical protein LVS60_12535 [Nodosilinea sp. LVE1205-7]|jgi:UDP-N-acetylmuramoylalanine--D-glutamate ligase
MAVTAACLAGIDQRAIAAGVANFPGVPHRLERIGTWGGIDFINDSKATNYDAAEVGLRSVAAPAILIAGGEPKSGEDGPWLERIQERAATVLLIGQAAPQFAERLARVGYNAVEQVETLDRAVSRARHLAPSLGAQVVLFSPLAPALTSTPTSKPGGSLSPALPGIRGRTLGAHTPPGLSPSLTRFIRRFPDSSLARVAPHRLLIGCSRQ